MPTPSSDTVKVWAILESVDGVVAPTRAAYVPACAPVLTTVVKPVEPQPARLPDSKPPFLMPPPAATVSVNPLECVAEAPVPVTVTEKVPTGVDALVEIVNLEEAPAVTEEGLNDAPAPAGRPLAENATVWGLPAITAVATVEVVVAPAVTVAELGLSDIEKS